MRTSSQRLAAVRKSEAMLLASVNCNSRCLNLGSYLQGHGDRFGFSTVHPPGEPSMNSQGGRLPEGSDGGETLHRL